VALGAAAALAGGLAPGGVATAASKTPGHRTQPLAWVSCHSAGTRCARLSVPLDYQHPEGRTITLAVTEMQPSNPSPSDGVLIFNPGGPGESGVQILPVLAALVPPEIKSHFDLVSFDERGTGASERIECGPSPAVAASVDPIAMHPNSPLPAAIVFAGLARSCLQNSPHLLATLTTANSARDMDRIRQALGVQKISYWGLSYGTVLGSLYAHLFPDRVRAMVLDGAVDATLPLAQQASEEAPAIAASLQHFFVTCAAEPTCPLGSDPAASYGALSARLSAHPLPAPGHGDNAVVTVGDLDTATLFYLSVPEYAGTFPEALSAAIAGNGVPLRSLSLDFEQDLDGSSLVGPLWSITCNDAASHLGPQAAGALARSLDARYPLDGAYAVTYILGGCVDWPHITEPVTHLQNTGAPPLLVVGNTGDPNTPHQAAVQLAEAIGSARLVTWDGWGHTWLLNGSNDACMQRLVSAYVVHLSLPPAGITCS